MQVNTFRAGGVSAMLVSNRTNVIEEPLAWHPVKARIHIQGANADGCPS